MRKIHTVIQPDAMDCGPVSLKIIAKYYGKDFPLEYLRNLTFTVRDGVSLYAISEAAEHIGFKTIGGRITIGGLKKDAILPCIVHWDQNHFIIVYKIKPKSIFRRRTKIYVVDPAFGKLKYSEEEFIKKWISTRSNEKDKGIVLLLEPTEKFYQQNSIKTKTRGLKFLLSIFLRYKKHISQLALGLLLSSVLQLIFPFLTQAIVDSGIAEQDISFIYIILLAQMMLILSRMSVEFIRNWILLHISTRINITLISDFFIKLMRLPMNYFDTKLTGDILQRIDDHRRIEDFLTTKTLNTIFSFFTLVILGAVLWFYSLNIFIIFFVGSIIYTLWIILFLKKRREIDFRYFEIRAKNQSKTYQIIQGMQEIKLQNKEKQKRWEWEDIQADLYKINVSSLKLMQIQTIGNIFINESKNIVITFVAAIAVINNEMTLGMMLATQYIIGQLTLPINQAVNFIHDLQDTKISLERINEIHQKKDENESKKHKNIEFSNKTINFKNLTFQYEGPHSKRVLNNISFAIPEGKVTAIVGASGSGKTTLLKLFLAYYKPVEGTIEIDNINIQDINTKFWRNQCGAVMQDGYIFSESIAQNIISNDSEIDKEKLLDATRIANIHDFIMSLPLKYNTIIGSEGQSLSQGQRQRILIARAVYKNPNFLVLDEATNSLDANNEKIITNNLRKFYKNKTVIIVAHRLSTVMNADQIIVLDDGSLIEIGTHKELIKEKGIYYYLVKNQLELGN
jgi:ATP-binding cassette subfamily B protein